MNFQLMNKQRRFILIASAAGIVSMFLPWVDIFFINLNGMHGRGIIVFFCFIVCGVIAMMGNQTLNLDKKMWTITIIVSGISSMIMIYSFLDAAAKIFTYGYYLALLSSLGIVVAAYFFRSPGQNLKDGFDSLKKDIKDKTK